MEKERVCILQRGPSGFGFILCCENKTTDTYVLHVLDASPARVAGLKPGDKIMEVNGINVEKEKHKLVVERLQGLESIRLVVAHNPSAEDYFKKPDNGMTVKPLEACKKGLRPKLISIKRNEKGFDFVLQTVGKTRVAEAEKTVRTQLKGTSAHYATSVRTDGVAYKAGLREKDRLIEINGVDIEEEAHAYVIASIKSSDVIKLLVVDKDTDEFFQRHGVSPGSKHLVGELEFGKRPLLHTHNSTGNLPKPNETRNGKLNAGRAISTPISRSPSSAYSSPTQLRSKIDVPTMAVSTPNLTLVGKQSNDLTLFDRLSRRQRTAKAKKEIKKQLSKLEKKPSKYNRLDLPASRRLYDDTVISDDTDSANASITSSPTQTSIRVPNIYSVGDRGSTSTGISSSVSDLSSCGASPSFSPKWSEPKKEVRRAFVTSECESPPPGYESPEELSSVGFNVDLETLKNHVHKKSVRSRNGAVKAKPQLNDYVLASMYLNSY